jgi:hypothetical protein
MSPEPPGPSPPGRNEWRLGVAGLFLLLGGAVYLFWIYFLGWYDCPPDGCLSAVQQARATLALSGLPVVALGVVLLIAAAMLRRARRAA